MSEERKTDPAAVPAPTCAVCGAVAISQCAACKTVWYCGRACQRPHWKHHKLVCATLSKQSRALSALCSRPRPAISNKRRHHPLYTAAWNGRLKAVKRLVARGVDVDMADGDGDTALYAASQKGHLDIVRCLVSEGGADVDKAGSDDATPLYIASQNGHLDIVKCLVSEGKVDVEAETDNGATPLWIAAANGHLDIVTWLVSEGGADVNKATDYGTPLYSASQNGHLDTVTWLVSEGKADVDKARTVDGGTPLFAASQKGHLDIVACLVSEGGADVDKVTTDEHGGVTPLVIASQKGHLDIVKCLVSEGGADVDKAVTDDGATPLEAACEFGFRTMDLSIVQFLVTNTPAAVPDTLFYLNADDPNAHEVLHILLTARGDVCVEFNEGGNVGSPGVCVLIDSRPCDPWEW